MHGRKNSTKTSDTDVIVLCIYFYKQMKTTSELWVQMGNVISVKDGRRFLPIHELCSSLPGLKQRSQFPDFQMNRHCNTDFQLALMGYLRIGKARQDHYQNL
jgi:hypothetical protein